MISLTDNAVRLLTSRYLLFDDKKKRAETPEEMFLRVAKAVAMAETGSAKQALWEAKFFNTLRQFLFLPNSPALMNAGKDKQQLSACFVIPVADSLDGIFSALKSAALIQQSGGGTGFNFSNLRPKGDPVTYTGGYTSGPLSFIKTFNAATHNIRQGGKRRGANMAVLHVSHPDIVEFVSAKHKEGELSNFNLSVGVTSEFMHAVGKKAWWNLTHPQTGKVISRIKANELWDRMAASAWASGDPGILFLDEMELHNPTPSLGKLDTTNPCGEVPLLPFESCNLGSVNLARMVSKDGIDWKKLRETVGIGVRFLDNMIDVNQYILPEIAQMAKGNRKIGLGVMGWADMLALLTIPYDSTKAVKLAEEVMRFIRNASFEASERLAKEKGSFLNWSKSIYYPRTPIRNATRTSIAPTGSISIIADVSSSIEPIFALAFERTNVLGDQTFVEFNRLLDQRLKYENLYSQKLMDEIIRTGMITHTHLPALFKSVFKTALEISYPWHLRHQAAFQKYTDNAISKTINLPHEATIGDIKNAFKLAFKLRTKGVTVYRSGCKKVQVLNRSLENLPVREESPCRVCSL